MLHIFTPMPCQMSEKWVIWWLTIYQKNLPGKWLIYLIFWPNIHHWSCWFWCHKNVAKNMYRLWIRIRYLKHLYYTHKHCGEEHWACLSWKPSVFVVWILFKIQLHGVQRKLEEARVFCHPEHPSENVDLAAVVANKTSLEFFGKLLHTKCKTKKLNQIYWEKKSSHLTQSVSQ